MNTKRIAIWTLFIAVLAGAIFLLYKYGGGSSSDSGSLSAVPAVRAEDKILGSDNAKVTIIEYADFQCPACSLYSPLLDQLQKDEPDKVRVVYRYFPLVTIHQNAMISAQAAEAAAKQGKFWGMHDALFAHQNDWAESGNAADVIMSLAAQIGLDTVKFKNDMNSAETENKVRDGLREATNLGLNSTPTFFVNGKQLEQNPRNLDEFKQLIDAAAQ